ncbi:MAG: class I SAM-dependent DNA methyltransferase, partial [FCB group bacterium]|nr:class I SAM-dependent DNA methyltransferase [FCB group bacterium]
MADQRRDLLDTFVKYATTLSGDEKGEAQVFLDRLFQGFGHAGYKEAGATLESRVRAKDKGTRFADLLWTPRVLIEMKKRGQNLALHYDQARDYWHDTYPKPRYVVLCNFDEFWVYDFFNQSDPVDAVRLEEVPNRYLSLAFLFPEEVKPQFGNDRVAVSRKAANAVAEAFNELIARGEDRARAQRFVLQCVF